MKTRIITVGIFGAAVSAFLPLASAIAQEAQASDSGGALQEIVVTAQKRQQNVDSVPMSITTASGEQLENAGIRDVSDLPKITPGLTYSENQMGRPDYTLRGIGYNDYALGARPAVTVYQDEAPIPFPLMTQGTMFDVERVEVLKGPQGTLFGSNSTGGAVNVIVNKPTPDFHSGGSFTYGRFNELDESAYVSGPITDTLSVRVAVEHLGSGDWQKSYTRDATAGQRNLFNGRLSVLWKPIDHLRALITVNRWVDQSDTQVAQAVEINPSIPPFLPLIGLATYPAGPRGNRYADWNPGLDLSRDDRFLSVSGRLDYDLNDAVTLSSISTYIDYEEYDPYDTDGVPVSVAQFTTTGRAKTYAEELRATAALDKFRFILGGNYEHDTPTEVGYQDISDSTISYAFDAGYGSRWNTTVLRSQQVDDSYAGFANVEYQATSQLTLQGGVRYTETKDDFRGCTADAGDGNAALPYTNLINDIRAGGGLAPIAPIPPGGCLTFNSATLIPGLVARSLDQNNVSWRVGAQFQWTPTTLLYANASKGYKAGSFGLFNATASSALAPAVQESVLAYEAGFKLGLFERALQLNGAVFYNDFRDKQVIGIIVDPAIGVENAQVNVPRSRVDGVELQLGAAPMRGLTINAGASYIRSSVLEHFTSTNVLGATQDFEGGNLPNVPNWQVNATGRYQWALSDAVQAFTSASVYYQSRSNNALGDLPSFTIDPYKLVDASAGVEGPAATWRAYIWGRNILDQTYSTATTRLLDTTNRFMGRPATFGITVELKY